jgi:hypothetical protein
MLYVRPVPKGLVIITTALPMPCEQSMVYIGFGGDAGCAGITILDDDKDVQPAEFVTVKV